MTNKQTLIALALVATLLVLIGIAARQRGALVFSAAAPYVHFNASALLNPRPSLEGEVQFPVDFPQEAREVYLSNLEKIKARIEEDPTNVAAWNDLAIYRKMVEDYDGAEKVWKYAISLQPSYGVGLHNLAELYFHTEKNYRAAQKYYDRSIAAMPTLAVNYADLHEMYRYALEDSEAAIEILKKGIESVDIHQQIDLARILAAYYLELGDTEGARTYYTHALELSQHVGNAELEAHFQSQLNSLDQ
jgi:tetratricopeptide (TPR) repeat protein